MQRLSIEYGMPWAGRWEDHLGDGRWLRRAVKNTYNRLSDDDKAALKDGCERFLEPVKQPVFLAECFILDGGGRRVLWEGKYKTVLLTICAETKREALSRIDTRYHQFKEWW